MKHFRMKKDEDGVSPVIAVILMVAITVVLAATVYAWTTQFVQDSKNTPRGHMTINGNSDNYYIATVQTMDQQGLGVGQADWFLISSDGTTVAFGKVSDIYGFNRDDPAVNVTFNDNDMDGKISANDNFQLKGTGHSPDPGLCGTGFTFTIKFTENDEVVMKQDTP